jgi:T5SS/PEP-CTERM-associated repeat protein
LGVAEDVNTTGALSVNGNTSMYFSHFVVGQRGTGTADFNGGTVNMSTGWMYIGGLSTANGTVSVSGGTIKMITGSERIHVGHNGVGTLTVSGGTLEGLDSLSVGVNAGSTGTVQLNGGTVDTAGFFAGLGTVNVNFNGGTIKARASNPNFFTGHMPTNSELQAGALIFDTNGNSPTIANSFDGVGASRKSERVC